MDELDSNGKDQVTLDEFKVSSSIQFFVKLKQGTNDLSQTFFIAKLVVHILIFIFYSTCFIYINTWKHLIYIKSGAYGRVRRSWLEETET